MKFIPVDTHGFGQRIDIKPIRKDKVEYVKVRAVPVPEPENENVKRAREIWNKLKEK